MKTASKRLSGPSAWPMFLAAGSLRTKALAASNRLGRAPWTTNGPSYGPFGRRMETWEGSGRLVHRWLGGRTAPAQAPKVPGAVQFFPLK